MAVSRPALSDRVFSDRPLTIVPLGFLGRQDLCNTAAVSKLWLNNFACNQNILWKGQLATLMPGFITGKVEDKESEFPSGINFKEMYQNSYRDVIGREYYAEHFGVDIGPMPRIPENFFECAEHIMYVPEYIPMELPEGSNLGLDENGRLTEVPLLQVSLGGKRTLMIPVTLNNIIRLVEKCLKKGNPMAFTLSTLENILQQHGNSRVVAHWIGQKKDLIGLGLAYAEQQELAEAQGFEVDTLIDRMLFNIFKFIRSGEFLTEHWQRTSTVTLSGRPQVSYQTTVYWASSISLAQLYLDDCYCFDPHDHFGVAVAVSSLAPKISDWNCGSIDRDLRHISCVGEAF